MCRAVFHRGPKIGRAERRCLRFGRRRSLGRQWEWGGWWVPRERRGKRARAHGEFVALQPLPFCKLVGLETENDVRCV